MELKNINESRNIIEEIEEGSIGEELEIKPGDILLKINGSPVNDIIDYKFLVSDDYILLEIEKPDGQIWEYEIEKDYNEDLGIIFTNPLIDRAKNCRNKCIFCFIDQLPPNMRETLYFKDDDSRLSFLQGNFITLTNMSDDEIDRIIKYKLSPINISVHTTNPELRIEMLKNKNAGKLFSILERFHEARLEVNCQIVLVPGINDGLELERTLRDLSGLYPSVKSVAVVPIGITKYRKGLKEVDSFDSQMSENLIKDISKLQDEYLKKLGTRFVFLSDEFYALSSHPTPSSEEYEKFPQLENGVGLMKSFEEEVVKELEGLDIKLKEEKKIIIATGSLAYGFMKGLADKISSKFLGLDLRVLAIKNKFFGESITVSGLITGGDLLNQLKGLENDAIIIPESMMKSDMNILLDNLKLEEVEEKLATKLIVSQVSGKEFINIIKAEVAK